MSGDWTERRAISWLSGDALLEVNTPLENDQHEPTVPQRALVETVCGAALREAVQEALLLYYESVRGLTDYGSEEALAEAEPALATPASIWSLLSRPRLWVGPDDGQGDAPTAELTWRATFDDEHGVAVELDGAAVIGVGTFSACQPLARVRARAEARRGPATSEPEPG